MKRARLVTVLVIIVIGTALAVFLNTSMGRDTTMRFISWVTEALGYNTIAIEIEPDGLTLNPSEIPTTIEIRAESIDARGRTSRDIRWRFLSPDGVEGPSGIQPLASPEYGEIIAYVTEPGVYVVEASDSEMAETMVIEAQENA